MLVVATAVLRGGPFYRCKHNICFHSATDFNVCFFFSRVGFRAAFFWKESFPGAKEQLQRLQPSFH